MKLLVWFGALPALAVAAPVLPQVEQAVRAHWLAHAADLGWKAPEVSVKLGSRAPANLQCASPVAVDLGDARHPTRMPLKVSCPDTPGWTHEFVARVALEAEVLVSAGAIAAGKALTAADVRPERRDVTQMADALGTADEAVGQSSRRALREGQVLQARLLNKAVLVKRGAAVRIVARQGGVSVENAGESLQAGSLGELVRVRNTASGKTLSARVVDEGVVEPAE